MEINRFEEERARSHNKQVSGSAPVGRFTQIHEPKRSRAKAHELRKPAGRYLPFQLSKFIFSRGGFTENE